MSVVNNQIINIKERISINLSLRFYAENLFKEIESDAQDHIVIDFDGVEFSSRSFTQEFLYRMNHCSKKITLINQSKEVEKMFEIVKSPREKAFIANYNPDQVINIML